MAKRIEEYAARLKKRLARRLPEDVAEQKAAEIRSHLLLAVEGQTDADVAERNALLHMGSDRLLAVDLIRSETGVSRRSAWRWLTMTILLLVTGALLMYGSPVAGLRMPWAGAWVLVLMLGVFLAACLRSRRWLVLPVMAAAVVVSTAVIAFDTSDRDGLSASDRAEKVAELGYELQEAKARLAKAQLFAEGKADNDPDYLRAPQRREVAIRHTSVLWPMSILEKRPHVVAARVTTVGEAKRHWEANGQRYLADLRSDISTTERSLQYWQEVPNMAVYVFYGAGSLSLLWLGAFTVLNALALGIQFGARRVSEHVWRRQLA